MDLIGRTKEIRQLDRVCQSKKSEFVALYGRRRVGKTFLVREYFDYTFDFQISGIANTDTDRQLHNFFISFNHQSRSPLDSPPENWFEAFQILIAHIEGIGEDRKKILFFDELPWLDTPKSDFIIALEHFWNAWATNRKDILLITCGSAASWMVNQLINNHGGLHNRVTERMRIEPFSLHEAELFLKSKNAVFSRYQIVQLYMVTGGIPFYLDAIAVDKSVSQNIEELCFRKGGFLVKEFDNLYSSLFKHSERYEMIVEALATKNKGLTQGEISELTGFSRGGTLTKMLAELEESGFVDRYTPYLKKRKGVLYRLTDFYSVFYFKFIKDNTNFTPGAWVNALDHPAQRAWTGFAFEQVCLAHIQQIKKALSILGVLSQSFSWRSERNKTQIDLLIDRRDHVINLCEVKFSVNTFEITKAYAEKLRNKIGTFKSETQTKKAVYLTMITTYGVENTVHKGGLVQNEVTMNDLFEEV